MNHSIVNQLSLTSALLTLLLVSSSLRRDVDAKEAGNRQQTNNNNNQPLANLDKVLKQANGIKVDAIMDPKLASNVTNALNEMAINLRKMLTENRRLSSQIQEVVQRVGNATGVNATTAMNGMQQQTSNLTGLVNTANLNSLTSLMSRFQVPALN